jgi:Na+/alanine symporter
MCAVFLIAGVVILVANASELPHAVGVIVGEAVATT